MAQIRAQAGTARGTDSAALNESRDELSTLRREVSSLRDTSTTFDMSFDAAISRLEHRVDRIEDNGTVTPPRTAPPVRTEDDQVILGQKG